MKLDHLSDEEVLCSISSLLGSQRAITARLIAHLGEVEERRLQLKAGFSSMFEFCVKQLGMSEGEAFRRIVAARLARRFPVIYGLVESGAIHLSALELLRERLTDDNHAELLEAASGKSKREVELLIATRFPAPDEPTRIRMLPERTESETEEAPPAGLPFGQAAAPRARPAGRPRLKPLSAARYKLELTISVELRQKLERMLDLMSHSNPRRDLEVALESAVDARIAELEQNKLGKTKRPRTNQNGRPTKPGYVTNQVRREVFRDGFRCSYVSADGRQCEATALIEVDHRTPRGQGGGDGVDNTRPLCAAHNQLAAEEAYGREAVERARHFRQQKSREQKSKLEKPAAPPWAATFDKLRKALENMGYREVEARAAAERVERAHAGAPLPELSELVREALVAAEALPRRRSARR